MTNYIAQFATKKTSFLSTYSFGVLAHFGGAVLLVSRSGRKHSFGPPKGLPLLKSRVPEGPLQTAYREASEELGVPLETIMQNFTQNHFYDEHTIFQKGNAHYRLALFGVDTTLEPSSHKKFHVKAVSFADIQKYAKQRYHPALVAYRDYCQNLFK